MLAYKKLCIFATNHSTQAGFARSRSPSPTSCADSAAGPEFRLWAPRFGAKGSVGELEAAARKSQEQRQEAGKSDVLVVARESQQQNLQANKSDTETVKKTKRRRRCGGQKGTPAAAAQPDQPATEPAMPEDRKEKVQHIRFYLNLDSKL